jgi:predicted DCC family thiol-disulfide oxidoreductase YuxK
MKNYWVVLYDGSCGFCNFWVKWILKNDKNDNFQFAPLQGNYAQEFLNRNHLPTYDFDSIYLIKNNQTYSNKLEAIIDITNKLGGIYLMGNILRIIPKFLRDRIYNIIAANRKKLMGESCYLPTPEERKKFIN